jgi:mono/diheme cytochrome c family protein
MRRIAATALWLAVAACDQPMAKVNDLAVSLTCPNDLPMACPSPAPSWSGDLAAIVAARCATCHAPGGSVSEKPLTDYAEVYQRRVTILTEVYACQMPPVGADLLSAAERQDLLAWLVCGAPNN